MRCDAMDVGMYDPWSVFGQLEDVSDSVVAVIIPEGAHHLDLMFRWGEQGSKEARKRTMLGWHVPA